MKMLVVLLGLMFSVVGFSGDASAQTFENYMRAAEEHEMKGRSEEAMALYQAATEVVTKQNKLRAYLKIIEYYYKNEMEWDAGSWHRKVTTYLEAYPKFKKQDAELYLFFLYYKALVSGKISTEVLSSEELEEFEGDDIKGQLIEYDIKVYYSRKNFEAVVNMFQGYDTTHFPMTNLVIYDLANFLMNKGSIKKLICSATLAKDPMYKDYSGSYYLCFVLENYLATKKKDPQLMSKLKELMEKTDKKMVYLYDALNSEF